jgi:hypothetical protein
VKILAFGSLALMEIFLLRCGVSSGLSFNKMVYETAKLKIPDFRKK